MIGKAKKVLNILRYDERPLRRLVGMVLLRMPLDIGRFVFKKIGIQNYFIRFHCSTLSLAFWHNPNDRLFDYNFMTSYLKEGDTYVDVGANIGTTLIPAAKTIGCGEAMAFEAHPKICSYLRENVLLNSLGNNVKVHNVALGNRRGYVTFSDRRDDDINRICFEGKVIKVPIAFLDDFTIDMEKINLLKIDVEGYEKFVVEGGIKTLDKTDCVYFEMSEEHFRTFGYSLKDLLVLLEEMNLCLFVGAEPEKIKRIDSDYRLVTNRRNAFAVKDIEDFIKRTAWRISE